MNIYAISLYIRLLHLLYSLLLAWRSTVCTFITFVLFILFIAGSFLGGGGWVKKIVWKACSSDRFIFLSPQFYY